jgi:hypothetical protein
MKHPAKVAAEILNAPEQPHRLTPTERLHEVTMAALARRPAETEHTVDISRNAKGVAQFAVAVRGPNLDAVVDAAVEKFDFLNERYPYPLNGDAK